MVQKTFLLKKYKENLLLYVQQIDDILGIWIDSPVNPTAWDDFQQDIQNCCNLNWKFTPLKKSVDFLDLTISLTKKKQTYSSTSTPTHSTHPA